MGAWIEIYALNEADAEAEAVAPHDGCVDWNLDLVRDKQNTFCRTPRWVRGLK